MKRFLLFSTLCILLLAGAAQAADTPEQVLAKYRKALQAGDFEGSLTYMNKANREKLTGQDPEAQKMLTQMYLSWLPESYKVLKRTPSGDSLVLDILGTFPTASGGKEKRKAQVRFKKESGAWKFVLIS